MNLKNLKLNSNDMELLKFLAKFKLMCAKDAQYFYNSTYYQKRLQELKNANYISRYYHIYIKLSPAGIRFLEANNIKCETQCRNKRYIERLVYVSQIGLKLLKHNLAFRLSWEMKGNNYTDWSRRFLGETIINSEKYLMYHAKIDKKYIRQLQFDINKDLSYRNVMVLSDSFEIIDNKNQFVFPNKTSCIIILQKDINKLKILEQTKTILQDIFSKELDSSDINIADYKVNNTNIVFMPFIDTHKIVAINNFFQFDMNDYKIQIVTFENNVQTIQKLLSKDAKEVISFIEINEEVVNET